MSIKSGQPDFFCPQLMDESRVSSRGISYHSKSKRKSSLISNEAICFQTPKPSFLNVRYSCNNMQIENIQSYQSLPFIGFDIEEDKTSIKRPIFQEIINESTRKIIKKQYGLLEIPLAKRKIKYFSQRQTFSILQPISLKQKKIIPIQQESQKGIIRFSTSSIQTNRSSLTSKTDISIQ